MKTLREYLHLTIREFFRDRDVRQAIFAYWNSKLPKVADDYADDTEAAEAGIKVGELYHTSGTVKIRLS